MELTSLEVISLIFVSISLVKIAVILINKKSWYNNVALPIYKNPNKVLPILAILTIIVFYFIIKELTFVQIFSVLTFSSLLIALGFLQFSKELTPLIQKISSKKFNFLMIVYILVWLTLCIFVIKEIIYS